MDLIHFGTSYISACEAVEQEEAPTFKPQGLWVSDESTACGWKAWCEEKVFDLERLAVQTRVHLATDARLCLLTTPAALQRFTEAYEAELEYVQWLPSIIRQGYAIHWRRVARDYQGIIITPYQHPECFDRPMSWYSGWHCASGCLWDAAVIARFEPVR